MRGGVVAEEVWPIDHREAAGLTARTVRAGRQVLAGRYRGIAGFLPFAGPAVIASVAYVDPGNYATNIEAGAGYGYQLLWVVVLANVVAMLFQGLSAKLGIVTGKNLAELCRAHFPRSFVWAMWGVSEIAAMATELAELLGGAIALRLLLGLPLLGGMIVVGAVTFAILAMQRRGFRPIELMIGGLVATISASYLVELTLAPPDWGAAALHMVVPRLGDGHAVTIAVGIVGATVMPHAIFLHSGLTQRRIEPEGEGERRRLLAFTRGEVVLALGLAGLVNLAMVALAAAVFHDGGHDHVATIETAYRLLTPLLGAASAYVFIASLLTSGIASSVVATMAGQVIMQGFVGFAVPLWLRRAVTMLPALVIVGLGADTTSALILSQVVLSLTLPVPMLALLLLTRRRDVMGAFANRAPTAALAASAAAVVLLLNLVLILQAAGLALPYLGAGG